MTLLLPGAALRALRPTRGYVCAVCGARFTASDTRATYCSNRCRQRAKTARAPNSPEGGRRKGNGMESLTSFFRVAAEAAIRETTWFRSAPRPDQAGAVFRICGVEHREFRGLGSSAVRPALVVECRCGGLVGTFSLLLQEPGQAYLLDEKTL